MTTIVYKDGIIAADTGAQIGGSKMGHVSKIARNKKGDLAGASGNATYSANFLSWFLEGEAFGFGPQADKDAEYCDRAIIVRRNRPNVIEVYEKGGMFTVKAKYMALGSGRPEACGAMEAGADAIEAVRIAMRLDTNSFGGLEVLHAAPAGNKVSGRNRRKRQKD